MALPLILGLAGSGLAGAGMLGGTLAASPFLAGALGSGLGSLLQGDDLGTAVGTGILSYFGGKMLGPKLAGAGIGSTGADPVTVGGRELLTREAAGSGAQSLMGSAFSPEALAGAGTGLRANESMRTPPTFDTQDDGPEAPEAEKAKRELLTPPASYRPGIDPEFNFFRPMQEGGLAALKYQEGGEMTGLNDKELISSAVKAIKGQSEEPQRVLGMFLARYGEEALRDLVERVQSGEFDQNAMVDEGMLDGAGDGMDDMIPATLEGEQDVVLSDGEFIVPADVVSGLGNGSSDAGADALYEMMDRVREMRTGMTNQPEQVPQGMMLPA